MIRNILVKTYLEELLRYLEQLQLAFSGQCSLEPRLHSASDCVLHSTERFDYVNSITACLNSRHMAKSSTPQDLKKEEDASTGVQACVFDDSRGELR